MNLPGWIVPWLWPRDMTWQTFQSGVSTASLFQYYVLLNILSLIFEGLDCLGNCFLGMCQRQLSLSGLLFGGLSWFFLSLYQLAHCTHLGFISGRMGEPVYWSYIWNLLEWQMPHLYMPQGWKYSWTWSDIRGAFSSQNISSFWSLQLVLHPQQGTWNKAWPKAGSLSYTSVLLPGWGTISFFFPPTTSTLVSPFLRSSHDLHLNLALFSHLTRDECV